MEHMVCPVWIGYLLLNPLRKLVENPQRMFGSLIKEGMTVMEPGCGLGYFTLPLAKMVGAGGRVVVLDLQEKMLEGVRKRAAKVGLEDRISFRKVEPDSLGAQDLAGSVDFGLLIHMVHETPDQGLFLEEVYSILKSGGRIFMAEPNGHIKEEEFNNSLKLAENVGFNIESKEKTLMNRQAVLLKG